MGHDGIKSNLALFFIFHDEQKLFTFTRRMGR